MKHFNSKERSFSFVFKVCWSEYNVKYSVGQNVCTHSDADHGWHCVANVATICGRWPTLAMGWWLFSPNQMKWNQSEGRMLIQMNSYLNWGDVYQNCSEWQWCYRQVESSAEKKTEKKWTEYNCSLNKKREGHCKLSVWMTLIQIHSELHTFNVARPSKRNGIITIASNNNNNEKVNKKGKTATHTLAHTSSSTTTTASHIS